ncbi:hypothetical protein [Kiloniella litopenaei]|uniref:hypothetical protein n=1 Tax=Kiloniella litopenaei TaxID=1549748 RepID=UPI003BAD37E8
MNNEIPLNDEDGNCHVLRVENLIAEGQIPVDVVTHILFETDNKAWVALHSNFDPIPLRLKLTKLGCIIDKQDTTDGWLFHIHRDATLAENKKPVPSAKASFRFQDGIITIDVRSFDYPNDLLEVLRFMDTSLDSDCFSVEIKRFTHKFQEVLAQRGWSCVSKSSHCDERGDFLVLVLEEK